MPPARRPLLDITNYNPTAFKTVAAAASAWRATIPVPVNKRRQLECIKAEEFVGREGDVARYIVEEACAGRIWNSYRSETVMARKNKARDESKQAKAENSGNLRKRRYYAKTFEWQQEYRCDHAGVTKYVPEGVRKRAKRVSSRCQCPAKLRFSKYCGEARVLVEHLGQHAAHDPTSLHDRRNARISPLLKEWLSAKLEEGHNQASLRRLLRLSDADLDAVEDNPVAAPDAFFLGKHDFQNLFRRILSKEGMLDNDLMASLDLWKEKIENDGGSVYYHKWKSNTRFQFCFITKWQKKLINEGVGKNIVCLDATHDTSFTMQYGTAHCPLFTLVAKHHASGMGVPLAFMICSSEEHEPLSRFLSWTTGETGYKPDAVMIDCSDTEALAITKAWQGSTIRYCRWHLFRAVWKQLRIKIKVSAKARTKAAQQEAAAQTHQTRMAAQRDFNYLLTSPDRVAFEARWQIFKQKWSAFKDWVKYVECQWIASHERWCDYGRTLGDHSIITNMYIESWHGTLKVQHLGNRRRQRVDLLLYILFEEAMPALRERVLKVKLEVNARSRTHAEQLRYNAAYQLPIYKAQAMVETDINSPGCLLVTSFTSEKLYRVKLQAELISSCNCQDHTTTSLPCKHMYLVERVLPFALSFTPLAERSANVCRSLCRRCQRYGSRCSNWTG